MKILYFIKCSYTRLVLNFIYALSNCIIGFITRSWWFVTLSAYYAVLATTRFSVLQIARKSSDNYDTVLFARKITGILLVVLSFCIAGINLLSAIKDRASAFHKIVMIAIATYAFTKITVAIIGMAKAKHTNSSILKTLRNISISDACVSIYSMQRSMLVSFPGMEKTQILIFNVLTGTAVWLFVLLLGINLIGGKYTNMAKSKIIKTTKQIAETVTDGYKKIENVVVSGYTKIEDKFVDAYLTKDGETVEEAKARIKNK